MIPTLDRAHLDELRRAGIDPRDQEAVDEHFAWLNACAEEDMQPPCPDCGGVGAISISVSYPQCCGWPLPTGECCGDDVEGRREESATCARCGGSGHITLTQDPTNG